MKIIIGITGASGVIYSVKLLKYFSGNSLIETSLILSDSAEKILGFEMNLPKDELVKYADYVFDNDDLIAPMSSGSYLFDSMIIIPCSMKTVAGIVNGFSNNLILRTADVTLKEGRKLILVPRETPLSAIHLKNLYHLSKMNVTVIPATPAFYHKPQTIDDLVNYIIGKILDSLNLENTLFNRWNPEGI
jgi:4-hydroxy-3-polyprenylbenzoate decarboxylase